MDFLSIPLCAKLVAQDVLNHETVICQALVRLPGAFLRLLVQLLYISVINFVIGNELPGFFVLL